MGKHASHPLLPLYIRVHTWWDVSQHTRMQAMYQVIAKHGGCPRAEQQLDALRRTSHTVAVFRTDLSAGQGAKRQPYTDADLYTTTESNPDEPNPA